MKKLITTILFLATVTLFSAGPTTTPPSVTLAWDVSTDTSVDGYAVYWGVATRNYTNSIVVTGRTTASCTISNLARGVKYYFAATSKAGALESDYSTEVTFTTTPLPPAPVNVRVTPVNP